MLTSYVNPKTLMLPPMQEALHLAALSRKSLTQLPGLASDWEINPDELEICHKPDGSEWVLGSGASAKVGHP